MQVSASPLGRLALPAIGLLFTAVGIALLVASLRSGQLFGIAFSAFWLSSLWWYLLNYSYDTALFANGDVRFRLLWGHRLVNTSNIKSVKVRRGEGSWLVIRATGPRVRMGNSSRNRELIRLVGTVNPAVKLPQEIALPGCLCWCRSRTE